MKGGRRMRNRLTAILLFMGLYMLSAGIQAGSIRCGGALVKTGDSSNQLLKKCGKPDSKFSSKATISEQGRQRQASVSNWVYRRAGKKDRVVSVYAGEVVMIGSD